MLYWPHKFVHQLSLLCCLHQVEKSTVRYFLGVGPFLDAFSQGIWPTHWTYFCFVTPRRNAAFDAFLNNIWVVSLVAAHYEGLQAKVPALRQADTRCLFLSPTGPFPAPLSLTPSLGLALSSALASGRPSLWPPPACPRNAWVCVTPAHGQRVQPGFETWHPNE